MVRWETATFAQKEKFLLSKYSPSSTFVANRVIEPFYLVDQPPYVSAILNTVQKPWSSELQGRNVLVVHPFSETIVSQYNKHRSGKHLFRREDVLPSFTLKTVKTFMTLAGAPPPHGSWTETLEATKRLIDAQAPFDVVLLGCGSYGMPLTRYVWEKHNATAVYVGGGLQLLFGIKGKRWDDENGKLLYNEHWVRPLSSDRPTGAGKVEGGAYW